MNAKTNHYLVGTESLNSSITDNLIERALIQPGFAQEPPPSPNQEANPTSFGKRLHSLLAKNILVIVLLKIQEAVFYITIDSTHEKRPTAFARGCISAHLLIYFLFLCIVFTVANTKSCRNSLEQDPDIIYELCPRSLTGLSLIPCTIISLMPLLTLFFFVVNQLHFTDCQIQPTVAKKNNCTQQLEREAIFMTDYNNDALHNYENTLVDCTQDLYLRDIVFWTFLIGTISCILEFTLTRAWSFFKKPGNGINNTNTNTTTPPAV